MFQRLWEQYQYHHSQVALQMTREPYLYQDLILRVSFDDQAPRLDARFQDLRARRVQQC